MKNTKAFTLIELLVVVLIIGILAAVALPQYQQAVNKTRFANLEKLAKSFTKASEIYFLANNKWPTQFDDLDIDLPSGLNIKSVEGGTCGQTDKIYCCIIPNSDYSPAIVCGQNDYSFAFHTTSKRNEPSWLDYCIAKQTDTAAVKLCNSLGTATNSWTFFTPEGTKTGYKYYLLK